MHYEIYLLLSYLEDDAVAAVDGTSHIVYSIEALQPQRVYYSGYRHVHCIRTLVIVDNEGILRYVNSGFTRSSKRCTMMETSVIHRSQFGIGISRILRNSCRQNIS